MNKTKPYWLDPYFGKYVWYRKLRGGKWYQHQFTRDALEICITFQGTWWAKYGKVNRYSEIIKEENFDEKN